MITVHHLENSRSQRILWLLEELGLDYDVKRYERDKVTSLAPKELTDVHPLGKSPIITDGDLVIAESGAIAEYLIDTYGEGQLKPSGGDKQTALDYRYWMHHAEGSAMPPLVMKLFFTRIKERKMPFFVKPIANKIADTVLDGYINPNVMREMKHWEATLAETGWFAGAEMTGADIMMSFPVEGAAARSGLGSDFPNLKSFLKRIHDLPTYRRALERGGPYALMTG
jgi:glutathione S-transferase